MYNSTALTVQDAQKILKDYDCTSTHSLDSEENKTLLREALLLLASLSDYQMLGVCADTAEQGILALEGYLQALGYEADFNLNAIAGAVYIKFNPKTGLCYIDGYSGNHRGVLVSCQSSQPDGINEMYGHLPLDLFIAESR